MTETQKKVLQELRESGHAIIISTPEELDGVCAGKVEDRLVELGNEVIE